MEIRWPSTYESATIRVRNIDTGKAVVSNLFARQRNKGHATILMRQIIDVADLEGVTLSLHVMRFGHPVGPDNVALIKFYEKFGFEVVSKYTPLLMERTSRKIQPL